MKQELSKPGKTSLLNQYIFSECMYERFLNATLEEAEEIFREKNSPGTKTAANSEVEFDNLDYFIKNKAQMEDQFEQDLKEGIGKKQAKKFINTIKDYWFDGREKRESKKVQRVMASVKNYLLETRKVSDESQIRVINDVNKKFTCSFEDDEIEEVLRVNRALLDVHLNEWLSGHPNYLEMGLSDLYCRRGLYLKTVFQNEEYLEWQYINSYSLSFSVTEKFSQMFPHKKPAIINTNYANIRDRILFFTPFIPGMTPYQLEFGVIPHYFDLKIISQGEHGGIHEFEID